MTVLKPYREIRGDVGRLHAAAQSGFFRGLKDYLQHPISLEQAKRETRRRIEHRDETFLSLVKARVFDAPDNLYRKLFASAGCDYPDLQREIKQSGAEGALEKLARAGVYLSPQELKGKQPVIRGGKAFRAVAADFESKSDGPAVRMQTTGTNNLPREYGMSFAALASRAFPAFVNLAAHDLASSCYGVYDAVLPANGGIRELLSYARLGLRADRWFARPVKLDSWLAERWHAAITLAIVVGGKRFGPGFPWPRRVDPNDLRPILDWTVARKRQGLRTCIRTTASNGAAIARAAREKGISLDATTFRISGEPFTAAKRDAILQTGARAAPSYGFEHGAVGWGCAAPAYVDDFHVDLSRLALIVAPQPALGLPQIRPLLVTSLDATDPKFYLNVDLGDYAAALHERKCGCLLEACGMTRHIHTIRSYEKFTAEGMNYFYDHLYDFLERDLPVEFGGGPGDYQLVEEEDADGRTRMTLLIHPRVGNVREGLLLAKLVEVLQVGSRGNEFQSKVWQSVGTLQIRRRIPIASPRGKILPLHLVRSSAAERRTGTDRLD
jgi:hypothetical protein